MRTPALLLAALALPTLAAAPDREHPREDDDRCTVEVGPGERFEQDGDAVVRPGERVTKVVALRGRVVVRAGAVVEEAVAIGGDVVVERGARVTRTAASLGGDVRLEADARVGETAVAIGGTVRQAKGARVDGNVVSLAFRVDGESLAGVILQELRGLDRCAVLELRERRAGPDGSGDDAWDSDRDSDDEDGALDL